MWSTRCTVLVVALTLSPTPGAAQIVKTIKDHATKKVEEQKKAADSAVVRTTDKAVDSALTKAGRPIDTLASRSSAVIDTTLNRSERTVDAGVGRLLASGAPDRIAVDLANGRVSLPEVRFVGGSDVLDSASNATLLHVAAVLKHSSGAYLVEAHVASSGNAAAELALSQRRALAVKAALTRLGVPVERLFAMGYGATRPPNGAPQPVARIEVARMQ